MNYETAKELLAETMLLGDRINIITAIVQRIEDPSVKAKFLPVVELLIGHSTDLVFFIERLYPDLNPDA